MERFKYSENIESNKLSLLVFWRHSLAVNLLKRYVVWALSIPSYLSSPMYPRITSWDAENVVLFVFCLHLPQCYIKGATQRIYTIFFQAIGIIKELFCLFFFSKDYWFQIQIFFWANKVKVKNLHSPSLLSHTKCLYFVIVISSQKNVNYFKYLHFYHFNMKESIFILFTHKHL